MTAIRFEVLGSWIFDIRYTYLSGLSEFFLGKGNFVLTNTNDEWTIYYKIYFSNLSDTNLQVPTSTNPLQGSLLPGTSVFRQYDVIYKSTTNPVGTNPSYEITGDVTVEAYKDATYTTLIDSITKSVSWTIIDPNNMTALYTNDFENGELNGVTVSFAGTSAGHYASGVTEDINAFSGLYDLQIKYRFSYNPWALYPGPETGTLVQTTTVPLPSTLSNYTKGYVTIAIKKTGYASFDQKVVWKNEDVFITNNRITIPELPFKNVWRKFVFEIPNSLTSFSFQSILGPCTAADVVYYIDDIEVYGV